MRLKKKFTIIFLLAILVFVGVNYYVQYFYIIPVYEEIDKNLSIEHIKRLNTAIDIINIHIKSLAEQYAIWDDTFEFVKTNNQDYITKNFRDIIFDANAIHIVLIFGLDQKLLWGKSINESKHDDPKIQEIVQAIKGNYNNILSSKEFSERNSSSGLIRVGNSILHIGACSIHPSYKNFVASYGTLVMAKVINSDELKNLSKLAQVPFIISLIEDSEKKTANLAQWEDVNIYNIQPISDKLLEVFAVCPDINGNFIFRIKALVSRELFIKSTKIANAMSLIIFLSGIILIGLIAKMTQKMMIEPLARIIEYTKKLRAKKDYLLQLNLKNKDELGELNSEINKLLNEIREHSDNLENMIKLKNKEIIESREEMVYRLALAAEERDDSTGAHLKRMYAYAKLLGKKCNLPESYVETISLGAILHDVGKIGIPDSILLKPAKLNPDEYAIIKTHSLLGGKILEDGNSSLMCTSHDIALSHHERYDGTGYPHGLKGEGIPLSARIVAILDVFDALISKRPYKEPWDIKRVIRFFNEEKGKMFDPQLVNLFLADIDSFMKIHEEYADN